MIGDSTDFDAARRHLAWLAHPVTLIALVLLLVNDHLLKPAYPGAITGKLSDVAGLVLAPPMLASLVTLLTHRAQAEPVAAATVAIVGAGFAAVKAFPAATAIASVAWSVVMGPSLVRADLTDLLTLPALGLAWLVWTRARCHPVAGTVARTVAPTRPRTPRPLRTVHDLTDRFRQTRPICGDPCHHRRPWQRKNPMAFHSAGGS